MRPVRSPQFASVAGARRARSLVVAAATCLGLTSTTAFAADAATLPVERFRPSLDSDGLTTTESGNVPGHLAYRSGLLLNYALNPLVIRDADNAVVGAIVAHRVAADALFSVGLYDRLSLGVDVPVTLAQVGGTLPSDLAVVFGSDHALAGVGLGDIRVVPKFQVLREERDGVSVAILPALTLPTASGLRFDGNGVGLEYGTSYLGEGPGAFAFVPEVAVSGHVKDVLLAGNLAYRTRRPVQYVNSLDVNPEFVYRGGAGVDVGAFVSSLKSVFMYGEFFGATPDKNPFGLFTDPTLTGEHKAVAQLNHRLANALEWAVGVRAPVAGGVSVEGGVGSGILPGYGSPDLRLFAGVRYENDEHDRDDDGVKDVADRCVDRAEDKDGYNDDDGCPDVDNDGDGLVDTADRCPDEAEDKDGFKDDDGCADVDNDGDGIVDTADRCPLQAGEAALAGCAPPDADRDGVPDALDQCPGIAGVVALSGCPDGDGDGVTDASDQCPTQAGVVALSGCPDGDGDGITDANDQCLKDKGAAAMSGCPDGDGDGITDAADKCPTQAETVNGVADDDGCPDKGRVLVQVEGDRIALGETVFFDSGKDTIQQRSFGLLQQVTTVLKLHPEVKKVSVEGHTDNTGDAAKNLDLSKRRAASVVRFLVDHGVDAGRLTSDGFGATKPIADNKTKAGREKNRRVELRIVP